MIFTKARFLTVIFFLGMLGILGACGKPGAGTGDQVGDGSTTATGTSTGGTTTTTDGNGTDSPNGEPTDTSISGATNGLGTAITNASSQMSAADQAKLIAALQLSSSDLNDAAGSLSAAFQNPTQSTATAADAALEKLFGGVTFKGLIDFFTSLDDAQYSGLLRKLTRMNKMRPVYGGRWYGSSTHKSRHFYTLSVAEWLRPYLTEHGQRSSGDTPAFWVYTKAFEACTRPVYRCYNSKTEGDYVSAKANCGGTDKRTDALGRPGQTAPYGYICQKSQSGEATLALERFYWPGKTGNSVPAGDYVVTRSKNSVKSLKAAGWKTQGSLGFPPSPPTF